MNNRAKVRRQGIALGNFRSQLITHSPEPKEDLVKLTNKALWVSGVSNTLLMMSILILVQYKDLKVFRPKCHRSRFSDRLWIYSGYPNF